MLSSFDLTNVDFQQQALLKFVYGCLLDVLGSGGAPVYDIIANRHSAPKFGLALLLNIFCSFYISNGFAGFVLALLFVLSCFTSLAMNLWKQYIWKLDSWIFPTYDTASTPMQALHNNVSTLCLELLTYLAI